MGSAGCWVRDCRRRSPPGGRPRPARPGCTSSSASPGPVGGGVYMNAGCHGGDWSEVVRVGDRGGPDRARFGGSPGGHAVHLPAQRTGAGWWWRPRCGSGRRSSPAGRADRRDVRVAPERHAVQPAVLRQRVQEPGGAELEARGRASDRRPAHRGGGLKGARVGGAEVSPMHANYFVNTGGATAAEVRGLIEQVQGAGRERVRRPPGAGGEDHRTTGVSTWIPSR